MLLDAALALEGGRHDVGGVVIAIAAQILDRDAGVGDALLDEPLDRRRIHRHRRSSSRRYGPAMKAGSQASLIRRNSAVDMAPTPDRFNASPPVAPRRWAGIPAALAAARTASGSAVASR